MKQKFNINFDGRDFFVGDIHGMYDLLMETLAAKDFDFEKDRLFAVGDLVDRGPQNIECLKLLQKPWFHAVKGNQEDMMLDPMQWHTHQANGGEWVNTVDGNVLFDLKELAEKMPTLIEVDTPIGRIGVVHADTENNWQLNCETTEVKNLWGRTRIHRQDPTPVIGIDAVVCGHTPLRHVVVLGNVVFLDTGAVFDDGFLTVMTAEEVFAAIENHNEA